MPLDVHTVEQVDGSDFLSEDRVRLGLLLSVANLAGAAGAAVVVAISGLSLPPNYAVFVDPGQDATWFVSGKTQTGFNVTLNPRLATNAIAAGTIDLMILA